MKQSVVILSLLLCLICAVAAKSGLSHKIRKSHRVALAEEEGDEEEQPVQLASVLQGRSPQDESSTEEEAEQRLDVRINAIREDNIEEGANLDYTELCQIKQGYVNLVTDYQTVSEEHPNMKANDLPILSIKRVFAVLNKQTLSVFENSNYQSLIKTINLSQIGSNMKPQRWARANCFQVMSRNAHHDEGNVQAWVDVQEPQDGALEAFCFTNEQKMIDWMQAIRNFQDCDVEVVDNLSPHIKDEIQDIKAEEQQKIDEIKSDCKKEVVHQQNEYKIEHQEDEDIEEELRQISAQLRKESAIETKQRLQYTEEAKRIEDQTCKLEKERECLEEMLRKREQIEQEAAAAEIETSSFHHEETLLQKAAKVVIQVKREETKKIKQQHEEYTKEQLKRQEQIKQHMVITTIQAEKNEDYSVCNSITKDNYKQVFESECSHEFIQDKVSCSTEAAFCSQCCAQYVGLNFMSTRTECISSCDQVLSAILVSENKTKSCEEDSLDQALQQENTEEATGADVPEEESTTAEAVAEEVVAEEAAAEEEAETEEVPEETVAERKHKKIQRLRRRLLRKLRK